MKISVTIVAITAILVGACTGITQTYSSFASQIIEYQISDSTYGVVVPIGQGVSTSQAKHFARQKAAEVTVANGGRYYTIQSEEQTQLVKSNKDWPSSQDFPGNLYQEKIIEGDFGRESLQRNSPPSSSVVPAYRMVFQIHENKPLQRSVDACTLTECD